MHSSLSKLSQSTSSIPPALPVNQKTVLPTVDKVLTVEELESYKPSVKNGEWSVSELDLQWIATGCYIMGCGGGGSPSAVLLGLLQLKRAGAEVKVIDLKDMDGSGVLVWGGGIGSPEVGEERLVNDL